MLNKQIKIFGINLNAQHVNGIIIFNSLNYFLLKVEYPHKNPIIVAKFNAAKVH